MGGLPAQTALGLSEPRKHGASLSPADRDVNWKRQKNLPGVWEWVRSPLAQTVQGPLPPFTSLIAAAVPFPCLGHCLHQLVEGL